MALSEESKAWLATDQNIWVSTVRPNGRPHLTPVWFAYLDPRIYICIDPASVKARNLELNPRVVLALEDGLHPVICEGEASAVTRPYPEEVKDAFLRKYEWQIESESQYNYLVEIQPHKWLAW
jgi:nitroimidazol reductase NimA-like FMN-containing flavoprotein (pyridoxamine 5'-phosphate oxidase superfamily)